MGRSGFGGARRLNRGAPCFCSISFAMTSLPSQAAVRRPSARGRWKPLGRRCRRELLLRLGPALAGPIQNTEHAARDHQADYDEQNGSHPVHAVLLQGVSSTFPFSASSVKKTTSEKAKYA